MLEQFLSLVDGAKGMTFLILFMVDLLAGIIVAFKEGTFAFNKLADFLNTAVLFYLAGYYMIGILVLAEPAWEPVLVASFALIVASLAADTGLKLKKLGLPIPDSITKILGG